MFSKQGTIIGCIALLALVLFAGIGPVMGMTQGTGEAAGSSAAPVLLQTPRLAGTLSTPTTATPMVAAGNGHTVGLKSDGTVVAVGENDDGQCDVTGWNDIVQVDAGFSHTVGLKADGTVIAVGNNYFGQCGVSGWSDVVQVAAGGDHTVGLKSDGTAVAVGENDDGQCNVSGWSDIVQVSAGLSHTVGLKSDGTAVAAPPGLDTWDLDGEGKPGIGDTWAYRGTDSGETFDWAETVTAHESLNGSMCYKTETVYDPAWQVSVEGYDVDLTVEGFRGWRGVSDRAWRLWQLDIEISGSPLTVSMEYAYTSSPYGAPFSFGKSWSYHTAQLSSPYSYDSTATVAGSLESVTVPAGTFNCYKIVHTRNDGMTGTEWWDADGVFVFAPIKTVNTRAELPLVELVSYPGCSTPMTLYPDDDNDGYGDSLSAGMDACAPLPGFASNNLDCDDSDPNVNPAATEIANGIDDDCDGEIDEGLVENHPPIASALSLTGQPEVMYPNTEYTVTAAYHDEDGMEDLKYCYLKLGHPQKPLVLRWDQATDTYSVEHGGEYVIKISGLTVPMLDTGYDLNWTFEINDTWPEAKDAIDFGVFAEDDSNLPSGPDYSFDDTNASFIKCPVIITPLKLTPEKETYEVGETVIAAFTLKNIDNQYVTLDPVRVGGRFNGGELPGGGYPDFTARTVTLVAGGTYGYEGTYKFEQPGDYHFFCTYHTAEHRPCEDDYNWNTNIDVLADGEIITDFEEAKKYREKDIQVAEFYRQLAEHWAPWWYQDTDHTTVSGTETYRADYITNFDFDTVPDCHDDTCRNWNATDNWENLGERSGSNWKYPLKAYIYYWVVETETHWFIGYADFHPRDWGTCPGGLGCHENDMEGCLLVVERDGLPYGTFKRMKTRYHTGFKDYEVWSELGSSGDHPRVCVEDKGHGVWATDEWDTGAVFWNSSGDPKFPNGDGIVYCPGSMASIPNDGLKVQYVYYQLKSIDELWDLDSYLDSERKKDTFSAFGAFAAAGQSAGANAPWGWDDGGHSAPEFFVCPAYLGEEANPEYLAWSFDTLPCSEMMPCSPDCWAWRQDLRPGDILLSRSDSPLSKVLGHWHEWTHAGIYAGGDTVIESLGGGVTARSITERDYPNLTWVTALRVTGDDGTTPVPGMTYPRSMYQS